MYQVPPSRPRKIGELTEFALSVDGYGWVQSVLGREWLVFARELLGRFSRQGFEGSFEDLRLGLFFAQRAYHYQGVYTPTNELQYDELVTLYDQIERAWQERKTGAV